MKAIERCIGGAVMVNRETFSIKNDGWVHVMELGDQVPHRESGKVQVFDRAALESIVARFKAEEKDLLVDEDHKSYDAANSSEAMAWVRDMEVREDGLWVRLALTDIGEEAVMNGRFRGLSPVWLSGDVEPLWGNLVRPLRMDSLGFTNQPNIKGTAWISNRQTDASGAGAVPPGEAAAEAHVEQLRDANLLWLKNRAAGCAVPFDRCLAQTRALNPQRAHVAAEAFTDADYQAYCNRLRSRVAPIAQAMMNRATTGVAVPAGHLNSLRDIINKVIAGIDQVKLKVSAFREVPDDIESAYNWAFKGLTMGCGMSERQAKDFIAQTFPELVALREEYWKTGKEGKVRQVVTNRAGEGTADESRAAANQLHDDATRIQVQHSLWTWEQCWNYACMLRPELVKQMRAGK